MHLVLVTYTERQDKKTHKHLPASLTSFCLTHSLSTPSFLSSSSNLFFVVNPDPITTPLLSSHFTHTLSVSDGTRNNGHHHQEARAGSPGPRGQGDVRGGLPLRLYQVLGDPVAPAARVQAPELRLLGLPALRLPTRLYVPPWDKKEGRGHVELSWGAEREGGWSPSQSLPFHPPPSISNFPLL